MRRSAPTIERARRLPPPMLHERMNGEYSFVETFRHLLFAWEAWLSRNVPPVTTGIHEWAVPPDLPPDAGSAVMWSAGVGWSTVDAAPDLDPVLDVHAERWARARDYLSGATAEDLKAAATPPPWLGECSVLYCFLVVLNDEWWHQQYASRDLAVLERG